MKTGKVILIFVAMAFCSAVPLAQAADLTWDANGATAGHTDGAGAWLTADQWWAWVTNFSWTSGDSATFGKGGAGGAVTLASPTTVNLLTFNLFTGTYTLGTAGQTITLNSGITKNAGSGAVSLSLSPITLGGDQTWTNNSSSALTATSGLDNGGYLLTISGSGNFDFRGTTNIITGSGGITKNGSGLLTLGAGGTTPAHNYSGTTTINDGAVYFYNNYAPGNITLNGGRIYFYYKSGMTRALGASAGQIQITGGESGFSANNTCTVNFSNNGSEVQWGSATFNPSILRLQDAATAAADVLTFANNIDLNGSTRTVAVNGTSGAGAATFSGVIRTTTGTAGLTKTGVGNLTLTAANTYDGPTTINGGWITLSGSGTINSSSALNLGGGTLRLVSTAQVNRFADGAAITSTGGGIRYENTSGANTYTETLGAVTHSSGRLDIVEVTDQVGTGSQTLTLGGLSRSGTASVTFSAAGTGPQASGSKNMIVVTGAGSTATDEIIGPWATVGTTAALQTDCAVYASDYVTGRGTGATTDDSTWGTTWASTNNVNFANGTTGLTLASTKNLNTLRHTGGAETLTVANGANLGTYGILNGVTSVLTIAATGTGAVTLPTTDAGSLYVNTGSAGITISAPITDNTGALTLVKNGTGGVLILSGTNSYSGDTVINAGTLQIGINNIANDAKLGGSGGNYAGNIFIADGSTLHIQSNASQILSGIISGNGNLTKSYNGTLTLSGANTYSGKTSITILNVNGGASAGTLSVSSFNSVNGGTPLLASSSLGCPTTVANGTIELGGGLVQSSLTLQYTGSGETTDRILNFGFNGSGLRTIDASGSGKIKFTGIPTSNGTTTGSITVQGSGDGEFVGGLPFVFATLNKSGVGTWTVGGVIGSTNLTVSAGVLAVAGEDCLIDHAKITLNGGKLELGDGIREKVGTLVLGSTTQANGTYGSTASKAETKDDTRFQGTGVLYVGIDIPPLPPAGTIFIIK